MKIAIRPASIIMLAGFFSLQSVAQTEPDNPDFWAFDSIHIPASNSTIDQQDPIIVAVVDDAFRLSHKALKEFIYRNPLEIPGNQFDDDGNGYADDEYGWDISDNDNDVSVPDGLDKVYYHGTYIASLITRVAGLHYGKEAGRRIKIMPVKVLSNQATRTYIRDGYKGIQYAMNNGADIICLAWSGGNPGPADLQILQEAHDKGILLIAAAGNFNEERVQYPASEPAVLAIAGINRKFLKEEHSSFGMKVDISAPAEHVQGAHPEKDNAYIYEKGTSAAAGLVTGCAAVILSKNEGLQPADVKNALLNASTPFDEHFSSFGGKMGAGVVHLEHAIDYVTRPSNRENHYSSLRSSGSISINKESRTRFWDINPAGGYQGFYLEPDISGIKKPEKHLLRIEVKDSIWNEYHLSNIPPRLFVPASSLRVTMLNTTFGKKDVLTIHYQGETVDSTRLYCRDTRYLDLESGHIDDGSGTNNYANNCSCKWIITAPAGKRIKFTFDQMDTQANVDYLYLVDGQTAIPENIIGLFSGQNIPPVVYSRTNEVLVWFVTDQDTNRQGWQFHYEFID